MSQEVYAASAAGGGNDRPGAVFSTLDGLKAYTNWKPGYVSPDQYGVWWGDRKVWGPIPLNPAPSDPRVMGGRKKTARRRRRTTRKH